MNDRSRILIIILRPGDQCARDHSVWRVQWLHGQRFRSGVRHCGDRTVRGLSDHPPGEHNQGE